MNYSAEQIATYDESPRKKLKSLGLDYHKIAEFFGYSSSVFANSTRRKLIEKGVLRVVEYIQDAADNKQPKIEALHSKQRLELSQKP